MEHFASIRAYLDGDLFVTYNWLARSLHIGNAQAQQLLQEYKDKHNNVNATYAISGQFKDHEFGVLVVPENNLPETSRQFSKIFSTQVFSLQRQDTTSVFSQLESVDKAVLKEEIMSASSVPTAPQSHLGGIHLPSLRVKPVGERAIAPAASQGAPTAKETPDEKMNRLFASRSADLASSTSISAKASSGAKAPSSVTNFFSKATTGTAASATKGNAGSVGASVSSDKTRSTAVNANSKGDSGSGLEAAAASATASEIPVVAIGDEEEEWDDGTGYKVDPERLKKRKKAGVEQFEGLEPDDGHSTVDLPLDTADDVQEVSKGAHKKSKQPVVVHGAMDDFFQEANATAAAAADSANGNEQLKKKKKKLVEKVFADEKGYLVTEMVWEEVSGDEEEAPPAHKNTSQQQQPKVGMASNSNSNSNSNTASAAKKTGAASTSAKKPQPSGQKSMTSFFTKKA